MGGVNFWRGQLWDARQEEMVAPSNRLCENLCNFILTDLKFHICNHFFKYDNYWDLVLLLLPAVTLFMWSTLVYIIRVLNAYTIYVIDDLKKKYILLRNSRNIRFFDLWLWKDAWWCLCNCMIYTDFSQSLSHYWLDADCILCKSHSKETIHAARYSVIRASRCEMC